MSDAFSGQRSIRQLRNAVVRFWETRRIWYTLALILPALAGFCTGAAHSPILRGEPLVPAFLDRIGLFLGAAIAANLCYTFVYVVEFLLITRMTRGIRHWCFAAGLTLAIMLAFAGGVQITMIRIP